MVLVIVLFSKFASGAWIVVVAMPVIWLTMRGIRAHYMDVALELTPPDLPAEDHVTLPASNRAIVLVSKLHLPTLRALAYARAAKPSQLEAITVDVDHAETVRLLEEWDRRDLRVPLIVVESPYREITRPVVEYVKRLRRESPRDIVTVYIPEYVLGHWWEQVLHNQSALRLKTRLLQQRGVIIASVPYQLRSATEPRPAASTVAGTVASSVASSVASTVAARRARGSTQESPDGPAATPAKARPPTWLAPLRRLAAGRDVLHAEDLQAELTEISVSPICDCADREFADLAGTLRTVTLRPRGASLTMEADLWDGTGSVTLIWLGRRDIPGIQPGRRLIVRGRITRIHGERAIYNPVYQLRPPGSGLTLAAGLGPVRAGTGTPSRPR